MNQRTFECQAIAFSKELTLREKVMQIEQLIDQEPNEKLKSELRVYRDGVYELPATEHKTEAVA